MKNSILQKASKWRKYVEPWYVSYALLGATMAGIAPILLPLTVNLSGGIAAVGWVMAAFNLGGLAAPIWGSLADRYHLHRWLMLGGLLTNAIALALFSFVNSLALYLTLALIQGAGASASATVSNLFIVEVWPSSEWDNRIGWLQTFYGGGQVGGLLLAGLLSQAGSHIGLIIAGGLSALALLPGSLTRSPVNTHSRELILQHTTRHVRWTLNAPQHFYHRLNLRTLKHIVFSFNWPFALFLIMWFFSFAGAAAFFSLYPVLMQKLYGAGPEISSAAFAVAAASGLALYAPAGRWSNRFSSLRVLQAALGVRLIAFVGLFALGMEHFAGEGALALVMFLFLVLAWSLMSVAGTSLAAEYSPAGEGEGMGIFSAITAFAGVIGSAGGGWSAGEWGYGAVSGLGTAGVAVGLVLSFFIVSLKREKENK
ncbi:MAG: MFS transporter [Candidatus Kryptoniota bacterium]